MGVTDLPYQLPNDRNERIRLLATIIGIEPGSLINGGQEVEDTLCGVILYRHLGRSEKQQVMSLIYDLPDKKVASKLVVRITDVLVNPSWGLWSMTHSELQSKKEFHSLIDSWSSLIGVGVTMSSGLEFISKSWNQRKVLTGRNLLTLIVWGGILYSKKILSDTSSEMERRKVIIQTPYH